MYNTNNPSNWSWSKAFAEMEKTVNESEMTQQCIMILGNSETTEYKNLSKSNQDEVYNTHKEKFESMNCFEKYKSYTNSNCVPKFCRDLQTITE
jgi:hypothetical protein